MRVAENVEEDEAPTASWARPGSTSPARTRRRSAWTTSTSRRWGAWKSSPSRKSRASTWEPTGVCRSSSAPWPTRRRRSRRLALAADDVGGRNLEFDADGCGGGQASPRVSGGRRSVRSRREGSPTATCPPPRAAFSVEGAGRARSESEHLRHAQIVIASGSHVNGRSLRRWAALLGPPCPHPGQPDPEEPILKSGRARRRPHTRRRPPCPVHIRET